MIIAKYKEPKRTAKSLWAGVYGGHYSAIVFFKKKPKFNTSSDNLYDLLDNKYLIVGCMYLDDFKELYPGANLSEYLQSNGRPKDINVIEVFKMKIDIAIDSDYPENYHKGKHYTFRQFSTLVDGWAD